MRILLADHFGLGTAGSPSCTLRLAQGLLAAGHQVYALVVDDHSGQDDLFPVRRVVCRPRDADADLPFEVPTFSAAPETDLSFESLTDRQLSDYRQALRYSLDSVVDSFDPDIIHAQHVWVLAQLALETGVPYALTAWPDELETYSRDARYRQLADQAAENAGRIFIGSRELEGRLLATFEGAAQRTVVIPFCDPKADVVARDAASRAMDTAAIELVLHEYRGILADRFGELP